MRAAFVLGLILSVAAPPVASLLVAAASPIAVAESSMGPPAGAFSQLVRDSATAEKTFSSGWFAIPPRVAPLPAIVAAEEAVAHAPQLAAIALNLPPLAPRPPPS